MYLPSDPRRAGWGSIARLAKSLSFSLSSPQTGIRSSSFLIRVLCWAWYDVNQRTGFCLWKRAGNREANLQIGIAFVRKQRNTVEMLFPFHCSSMCKSITRLWHLRLTVKTQKVGWGQPSATFSCFPGSGFSGVPSAWEPCGGSSSGGAGRGLAPCFTPSSFSS